MGKNDRCAVWGCDNDRRYSDRYVIKPYISKWDQSLQMNFSPPKNEYKVKTWIKLINICFCRFIWKKENIPSEQIHQDSFKSF